MVIVYHGIADFIMTSYVQNVLLTEHWWSGHNVFIWANHWSLPRVQ